ncbi:MAG: hypothetical protein ACXWC4_05190 [Telluria sp.]
MTKYLTLPLLLAVSSAALADDAALQQCRALADAGQRLACYDAIVPAPAAAKNAGQDFGMEQMKKQEETPKAIESTIVGSFDGWGPNSRIKLANGQVWRIIDGSEAVLAPMQNPKVRIERNFIGTIFMKVEGTNNSAKVRRVQ